jgi:fluoride exporter
LIRTPTVGPDVYSSMLAAADKADFRSAGRKAAAGIVVDHHRFAGRSKRSLMTYPDRHVMPTDSDIDVSLPEQRAELASHHARVLWVIAAGGVIGALARYQVGRWWPTPADGFPTATLTVNLVGCLLIGVLMVVVTERWSPHPLVRPFLGTGVLGGFTTFSTYSADIQMLIAHGRAGTALAYLAGTAVGAVVAVALGISSTRRLMSKEPA